MARTDWIALVTAPAAEYMAYHELIRLSLSPYLPQTRQRHFSTLTRNAVTRCYPLFPRYLFLPFRELDHVTLRLAKGLSRPSPVLSSGDGNPWRAPEHVIVALKEAEASGAFDDVLKNGDKIRINHSVLANLTAFVEDSTTKDLHVLTPLLGGARARVARARVTKL